MQSIVYTLIYHRLDPIVFDAEFADLCHFPGLVVTDCEAGEETFFVEIVDCFHGLFEGCGSVGTCGGWSVECDWRNWDGCSEVMYRLTVEVPLQKYLSVIIS